MGRGATRGPKRRPRGCPYGPTALQRSPRPPKKVPGWPNMASRQHERASTAFKRSRTRPPR
eukprot:7746331-Pyramimonas_sp.AAC.1